MKKCIDCPKKVKNYYAKRCLSCAMKFLFKNPKNHPNFKGGSPKCLDCDKELLGYTAKRCWDCYCKWIKIVPKHQTKKEKSKRSKTLMRHIVSNRTKQKISKSHIGLKHTKQTKQKMSLSKGGTGISHVFMEYGAEFDSALKELVRQRDHYKCQICGCSQVENGRQLDCHHKDYNKKHNNINNLISLCHSCHAKTNTNRKYWKNYFLNRVRRTYGF